MIAHSDALLPVYTQENTQALCTIIISSHSCRQMWSNSVTVTPQASAHSRTLHKHSLLPQPGHLPLHKLGRLLLHRPPPSPLHTLNPQCHSAGSAYLCERDERRHLCSYSQERAERQACNGNARSSGGGAGTRTLTEWRGRGHERLTEGRWRGYAQYTTLGGKGWAHGR